MVCASVSLREDGSDCEQEGTMQGGCILGTKVGQIVNLLMSPGSVQCVWHQPACMSICISIGIVSNPSRFDTLLFPHF